jgi:hypothetical protein
MVNPGGAGVASPVLGSPEPGGDEILPPMFHKCPGLREKSGDAEVTAGGVPRG